MIFKKSNVGANFKGAIFASVQLKLLFAPLGPVELVQIMRHFLFSLSFIHFIFILTLCGAGIMRQ